MKVYVWYPVRCSSCNKHLGHFAMDIQARLEGGEELSSMFMNDYTLLRVCCKNALMNPCAYNLGAQDDAAVHESAIDGTLKPEAGPRGSGQGRMLMVRSRRFEGSYIGQRSEQEEAEYQTREEEEQDLLGGDESEQLVPLSRAVEPTSAHTPTVPGVPAVDLQSGARHSEVVNGVKMTWLLGRTYMAV